MMRDHPRGCGENTVLGFCCNSALGSPPRMRGKPQQGCRTRRCGGITPADAGKTRLTHRCRLFEPDHPRGCGENIASVYMSRSRRGSPPRMRGKLCQLRVSTLEHRITPADAGKTTNGAKVVQDGQDHPRGCGENLNCIVKFLHVGGSPPRMRGKLSCINYPYTRSRITPADAGKTFFAFRYIASGKDHPRGCGENNYILQLQDCEMGSPPRMRGKHPVERESQREIRITPADAGKTIVYAVNAAHTWDHPRGCGENDRITTRRVTIQRITPADAGKTL